MHDDADPLLTEIFAAIEPAVLRKNGQPLEALGYQMAYALDLARHPYPMSQTLYYARGVLGMTPPLTLPEPERPGGVSFLHAHTPGIVLGAAALAAELPDAGRGLHRRPAPHLLPARPLPPSPRARRARASARGSSRPSSSSPRPSRSRRSSRAR